MKTPKNLIQDLYSDKNLSKAYLMKTQYKPIKIYSDISAFTTNTKAMQKMMLNPGPVHLKPGRQSFEGKNIGITNTFSYQNFFEKETDNRTPLNATQNFASNKFSFIDAGIDPNQRRFSTPTGQKNTPTRGLSQIFCQTPVAKAKFEGSPLKTNDSHFTGEDSRERRSMSSVKRNKYLTVVSRMPVSKKKDTIKL